MSNVYIIILKYNVRYNFFSGYTNNNTSGFTGNEQCLKYDCIISIYICLHVHTAYSFHPEVVSL